MTLSPSVSGAAERAKAKAMATYPRAVAANGGAHATPGVPVFSNVLSVIRRIETYLDEETAALNTAGTFDLAASNNRKSQGLLELNRAMRALGGPDCDPVVRSHLAALRVKLENNMRVIRLHLSAVKEISELLSDAIQSADSDGTYSPAVRAYRGAP